MPGAVAPLWEFRPTVLFSRQADVSTLPRDLLRRGLVLKPKGRSMDTTDLVLAIVHHLLVFSLAGIIGAEFVLIRGDLPAATLKRLAGIDRHYGIIAALIIIIGIGRVFWGLKGWEFYVYNWVFWAKMVAFGIVGLLSIVPTVRFISWNRQASANPSFAVPASELASVKTYIRAEAFVFLLIPVFAAAMARGYGY
jgi:putative membrane protein